MSMRISGFYERNISLYRKFGFKENGEINGEETVFELKL